MPTKDYSQIVRGAFNVAERRGAIEFDSGDLLESFLSSDGKVQQLLGEFGVSREVVTKLTSKLRLVNQENQHLGEPRQSNLTRAWVKTFSNSDDDRFEDSFDLFQVLLSFESCLAQRVMLEARIDLDKLRCKVTRIASSRPNFSELLGRFGNHEALINLISLEQKVTSLLQDAVASGDLEEARIHHDYRVELYSKIRSLLTSLNLAHPVIE